ncbi:MAG TPA: DUF1697 domain-containing protein [Vicinamibacterales bacterium]|jgi:uncharacterized protein (DUF1697 family)
MPRTQYLALLRGINVGGGNIIRMADLKRCLEASRLENVATYIASGNVLFESAETNTARLAGGLERALSRTFSPYKARLVLCSHAKLEQIVRKAPTSFGSQPKKYRYDVIFLKEPITAPEAMKSVTTRDGVDRVVGGPDVLYFSRLIAKAAQSRLTRIVTLPVYQSLTIRSWNTTIKLLTLMDARAQPRATSSV